MSPCQLRETEQSPYVVVRRANQHYEDGKKDLTPKLIYMPNFLNLVCRVYCWLEGAEVQF